MGSYCLVGTGFQSEMKKFWEWVVGTAAQQCVLYMYLMSLVYTPKNE